MAADEQTTWGAVCGNVGFSDNLYRTCRQKVPGFQGAGLSRYDEDEYDDDDEPISRKIAKSALPVPEPPPADWEDVEAGLLEDIFGEDAEKYLLFGGIAIAAGFAAWWFLFRGQTVTVTETPKPQLTSLNIPGLIASRAA